MGVEYVALIVSLVSLLVSIYFSVHSMRSSQQANDLTNNQKTMALIGLIAPACQTPDQWAAFIKYLARHQRLPSFDAEDEQFLNTILARLSLKAQIVNGGLKLES